MKKSSSNVVYGYFDDVPNKEKLNTGSVSKVQHHHADSCDMKLIISRFLKTGEIKNINQRQMEFLDVTHADEYDRSLQLVIDAENLFYELSANVRERFNNNPKDMLSFVNDPTNIEEAIELGLAKRKPGSEPLNAKVEVETVPPSPKGQEETVGQG